MLCLQRDYVFKTTPPSKFCLITGKTFRKHLKKICHFSNISAATLWRKYSLVYRLLLRLLFVMTLKTKPCIKHCIGLSFALGFSP